MKMMVAISGAFLLSKEGTESGAGMPLRPLLRGVLVPAHRSDGSYVGKGLLEKTP